MDSNKIRYSGEIIDAVWSKAREVEGLNPDMFRLDQCGALIMRDKLGKANPFGWVPGLVYPEKLGGDDRVENLRAMHYMNDRSKRDDYPSYTGVVVFNGKENVETVRNVTVCRRLRDEIRKIYGNQSSDI